MSGPDEPCKATTRKRGGAQSTPADLDASHVDAGPRRPNDVSMPDCATERADRQGPAETPRSEPRVHRRLLRGIVMVLVVAALTWSCVRLLNMAFPESPKEVVIPEAPKTLRWSIKERPLSKEENRKLEALRRDPPEAGVLAIYVENDGDTQLDAVTLLVECDQPIVAHVLPLALRVTDVTGEAITDHVRHFAYERFATFTYHNIPSNFSMVIPFIVPRSCKCQIYCQIDDRFAPAVEWPESAKVQDDVFEAISYQSDSADVP